ncbi:MAG: hypothetical protein MUF12_00525 [Sediminibacterium sp.]|jgi:hypothetical protein|nr:hypothetical protein [Sediminibacterium sp.]
MEITLYTITNISNQPIKFFKQKKSRDEAFEKLPDTYRKRFGKDVLNIKTED